MERLVVQAEQSSLGVESKRTLQARERFVIRAVQLFRLIGIRAGA